MKAFLAILFCFIIGIGFGIQFVVANLNKTQEILSFCFSFLFVLLGIALGIEEYTRPEKVEQFHKPTVKVN